MYLNVCSKIPPEFGIHPSYIRLGMHSAKPDFSIPENTSTLIIVNLSETHYVMHVRLPKVITIGNIS